MKNRITRPSRFRPHPYFFVALCTAVAACFDRPLVGLAMGLFIVLLANLQD